jgi:two-component system NtrC family sensor kinase
MKVLIAEDDNVSGLVLKEILTQSGHEVSLAGNGLEAWEMLQENPVDLVVTEWILPGMDGQAICEHIRSLDKTGYTYIVILTKRDNKQDLIKAFEAGADDYITKPVNSEEFRARIKTYERIVRLEQEHRELEHNLIESRNKLRIVFDNLQEEVFTIDEAFRIISVNMAFLNRRGGGFSDSIGRSFIEVLDDSVQPPGESDLKSSLAAVFETGAMRTLLDTFKDADGNIRYREIRCAPIRNKLGEIFQCLIVMKDITEERRSSEEIRSLNQQLQKAVQEIEGKNKELRDTLKKLKDTQAQMLQSEKMSSIGQLAAGVAHEINNPTGFVSSNLKTLADYHKDIHDLVARYRKLIKHMAEKSGEGGAPADDFQEQVAEVLAVESEVDIDYILEDIQNLLTECHEGTERIKKIVVDLKDFAHPGKDTLQGADINKGIESTLNVVWNELKYKATVTKDLGKLPLVECYPQQINQVLMNLFVNAAQAIPEQGEIRISTRADNGHVDIEVNDSGEGIPQENLSKIFDPFFTTKEVGKGTGLGLNVAYNIIRKHKGTITAESTVGKGTTFKIRLPVNQ